MYMIFFLIFWHSIKIKGTILSFSFLNIFKFLFKLKFLFFIFFKLTEGAKCILGESLNIFFKLTDGAMCILVDSLNIFLFSINRQWSHILS